jgi:hypothetical protein
MLRCVLSVEIMLDIEVIRIGSNLMAIERRSNFIVIHPSTPGLASYVLASSRAIKSLTFDSTDV